MDGLRLSLVMPAHNEQAGLRQAVAEADEALSRLCEDYEILVVDDGSRDGTAAIAADEAARRPRLRLLRHPANRGYGAALRTGFEAARFDLVAFTDADCQFHLDDLALLVAADRLRARSSTGWRIDRKDPWRRRFLSAGYNLLARTLLGTTVRDVDCALKVFRREALLRILPESPGFFANAEMFTRARQLGLGVAEVGVRHRPRFAGPEHRVAARGAAHAGPAAAVLVDARSLPRGGQRRPRPRRWAAAWPTSPASPLLARRWRSLLFFLRLRAPLLEPQEAALRRDPAADAAAPATGSRPSCTASPTSTSRRCSTGRSWAAYELFGVARPLGPARARRWRGVLLVLVTSLWGRAALGARAGLCGAAVLCLMPELVYRGRMLSFDVLLALWVTAALAAAPRRPGDGPAAARLVAGLGAGVRAGAADQGPGGPRRWSPVPLAALAWIDPRLARPGWRGWAGATSAWRCGRGGPVVRRGLPASAGLRGALLLEAQRGALRRPVRPRPAGVVLPAGPAPGPDALDAAAAGAGAGWCSTARRGRPSRRPAGAGRDARLGAVDAAVLLGGGVQAADLPAAGPAARWPWRWAGWSTSAPRAGATCSCAARGPATAAAVRHPRGRRGRSSAAAAALRIVRPDVGPFPVRARRLSG